MKACIRRGVIVIRLPVDVLPDALKQNPRDDSYYDTKICDLEEFARDVARELNREAEDGTTPVHLLFDAAMAAAIDNGSVGIDYTKKKKPNDGGRDG